MPKKNSGFKLPRQTAKQNKDKFYTTIDRVNGVTTELRRSKNQEPLKVLDFSCGDPFYNIREENKKLISPVNQQIDFTVSNLGRYPKIREEIQTELQKYKEEKELNSGISGLHGSGNSHFYIKQKQFENR